MGQALRMRETEINYSSSLGSKASGGPCFMVYSLPCSLKQGHSLNLEIRWHPSNSRDSSVLEDRRVIGSRV